MSFDVLPTELLQIIFNFTTLSDQKTISLVCQRWSAAVEPILLARTYLTVYQRAEVPPSEIPSDLHNILHAPISLQLIDKNLLINSSRNYTHLKVEWSREPNMRALQEVLNVCLERFPVQKLYFKASLGIAIAELLSNLRDLLENITELCVAYRCDTAHEQSAYVSAIPELSLPNLKQLTWLVSGEIPYASTNNNTVEAFIVTLHVPELDRLKVRIKTRSDANQTVYLGLEHAHQCCLFLPSLNLKSCSKLQHVVIYELTDLDHTVIDHSAAVLHNMKSLTLLKCNSHVIEKLCRKCSKLEELNVHYASGRTSLEIFSLIPQSLRKLSIRYFPISFNSAEKVVFPELRYIRLIKIDSDSRNQIFLDAPKLTTIVTAQQTYNLMKIVHKAQIRTMAVHWYRSDDCTNSLPPPNVTELFLCLRVDYDDERETLQDYLKHYRNLRSLTVFGKQGPSKDGEVELSLRSFPNLDLLYAVGVTLRLADFHALTHLKSLTLSDVILKSNPDDVQIMLNELEYFRAHLVVTEDADHETGSDSARNLFPFCGGNVRHPPVVKLSTGIFSSTGFKPKLWPQIVPTK